MLIIIATTHCPVLYSYAHNKQVAMLAPQLIDRIEFCHSKGLIHRDVKPNNFVLGIGKSARRAYLIDFGLSTRYWKPGTRQHIDYEDGKRLTGTARCVGETGLVKLPFEVCACRVHCLLAILGMC